MMMRGNAFLFGAILGGAFIASCLNDNFRNKCRAGINALSKEIAKQCDSAIQELNNNSIPLGQGGSNGQRNDDVSLQ